MIVALFNVKYITGSPAACDTLAPWPSQATGHIVAPSSNHLVFGRRDPHTKDRPLAKPNHQFEKRQRELAKQKKKEEKRQRKLEKGPEDTDLDAAGTEAGDAEVATSETAESGD